MATRKIVKHLRSREHTHIGDEVIPVKPLPRQMEVGEIAMNYLAGFERLYIKNSEDEVVTFYPDGGGSTPVTITVDDALSTTSENPVQNKVITEALDAKQDKLTPGANITINENNVISASTVTVDTQLSERSTNPVQNRVITEALNGKQDVLTIDTELDEDSTNLVQNKAITETILSNELVTAAALSKLNESAGFNENGEYDPKGTNYIENAISLSEAVDILDSVISGSGGTDEKVSQSKLNSQDSATDVDYPLLLANNGNPNGASAGANYSNGIKYNPREGNGSLVFMPNQTSDMMVNDKNLKINAEGLTFTTADNEVGTLTRTNYSGTSGRATADSNGDNIVDTYLKKADLNALIGAYIENELGEINGGEYRGY